MHCHSAFAPNTNTMRAKTSTRRHTHTGFVTAEYMGILIQRGVRVYLNMTPRERCREKKFRYFYFISNCNKRIHCCCYCSAFTFGQVLDGASHRRRRRRRRWMNTFAACVEWIFVLSDRHHYHCWCRCRCYFALLLLTRRTL